MNPYTIGIISSIAVYLLIGNFMGRRVKSIDDYYVAGRNASTLLIVGTLVASFLSTAAFLGETGFIYEGHAGVLFIMIVFNLFGYVTGALFFGRYIRRSQAITVAEYFGKRFASHRVQSAAGVTIIVGLAAYLLAVTQGASLAISEAMDIPYDVTLFIVWLGYTWFTAYSGSKGVVVTDTIMFLLFTVVAFLAVYSIIAAAGGWFYSIEELATFETKPGILAWHGVIGPESRWQNIPDAITWGFILGIAWGVTVAVSPWQSSRYLMAKDEHTVVRAACVATAVTMLFYCALIMAAVSINLIEPNIQPTEKAMIWAAMNVLPTFAGVLLMSGIIAAALSSASTFLSLIAFSATNDLIELKTTSEGRRLAISRYAMLVVGIVILVLAYLQPPAILAISYFAATLFASSWGPVAFMSVWSKRITANGAFWGIVVGFSANFSAKLLELYEIILLPVFLHPIVIGIVMSTATIIIVSACGQVSYSEKKFHSQMHNVPSAEIDVARTRGTLRFAKGLILCGVILTLLLIVFYVIPYENALERAAIL